MQIERYVPAIAAKSLSQQQSIRHESWCVTAQTAKSYLPHHFEQLSQHRLRDSRFAERPSATLKVAESGNRRAQVFRPECATPLFGTAPENATQVVIRLGCVKQRANLEPAVQIWQCSTLPWLTNLNAIAGSQQQQAFLPAQPLQNP